MTAQDVDMSGKAEWRSENGRLQLGSCNSCGALHYYPRHICPFCHSLDVGRKESSGRGRIYSHSISARTSERPHILAYVTLEEGLTMLTNIVDVDPDSVHIDLRVELVFRMVGDWVPFFRPVS